MTRPKDRLHKVIVIGATPTGITAVNKLGELGIPVTLVDTAVDLDRKLAAEAWRLDSGLPFNYAHRPGLIRILRNANIDCVLPARVDAIRHDPQGFAVTLTRQQTFVDPERCILCGRCAAVCPVDLGDGEKAVKFTGRYSLPGRPVIDKRRQPLCRESCPLGVNAQGYMALTRAGKYAEALALIREENILPGICGRICTHPCEDACRRKDVDDAVSIRAVKRFLADYGARHPDTVKAPQPAEKRKETFAVIGSGPAGLAAAARLAKAGCQVRIYEREPAAGGLLRYGIGPHRLPRAILDAELAYIENMGVEFILNHPVDLEKDLSGLRKEMDGVLVATGSWKDRPLGAEGENMAGVEGCLAFLNRYYRGEIASLEEKVAVIGDGNAAFDLARTLARIGADVTLISWFGKDTIPADMEEVKGAVEEGVDIIDRTRIIAFEGDNRRFRRLRCKPTQPGPAGADGIAWPVLVPGGEAFTLDFDRAFVAIGQVAPELPQGGLKLNTAGYIAPDEGFRTHLAGIYAAGDGVGGPSSVVSAMAQGKQAADQMLAEICGIRTGLNTTRRPPDRDFPEIGAHIPVRRRTPMPEKRPEMRHGNFDEVALGLPENDVLYESQRCLQCGVCSECMECADACRAIGAVRHGEDKLTAIEHAGVVIIADPGAAPAVSGADVIRAYGNKSAKTDIYAMIMRGFAAAGQAMVLLSSALAVQKGHGVTFLPPDPPISEDKRIGVFVCSCNRSLGWSDDLDTIIEGMYDLKNVVHSEVLPSACVPEGVADIIRTVRDKGITRVVLGSCVCCSLDFACSACTDQRSRLKHALFTATGISRAMVVTRNIRGEALSLLEKDPEEAALKLKGLLVRSVNSTRTMKAFPSPVRNCHFGAAVVGASEAAVQSAVTLAQTGMDVFMFAGDDNPPEAILPYPNIHCYQKAKVDGISGTLGDFTLDVRTGDLRQRIHAGTVVLGENARKRIGYARQEGMPDQDVICTMQKQGVTGIPQFYPGMTSIAGLFLANPPGIRLSNRLKGDAVAVLAAAVMPRGPRKSKGYTVTVDTERCRGCGRCVDVCPYQAVTLRPNEINGYQAWVDEAFCKGCGNCASVCPTGAADSPYRNQVFFEQTLEEILI